MQESDRYLYRDRERCGWFKLKKVSIGTNVFCSKLGKLLLSLSQGASKGSCLFKSCSKNTFPDAIKLFNVGIFCPMLRDLEVWHFFLYYFIFLSFHFKILFQADRPHPIRSHFSLKGVKWGRIKLPDKKTIQLPWRALELKYAVGMEISEGGIFAYIL